MKVCIISDYLPGYHKKWSGAELIAATLGKMLQMDHCEVFFLTTPWDYSGEHDRNVVYSIKTFSKSLWAVARNFPVDIKAIWSIYKKLKAEKPDVVHINAKYLFLPTVVVCLALKIPTIFTVPDYFIFCPTTFIRKPDGSVCTSYHGSDCINCLGVLTEGFLKKLSRCVPKFVFKIILALRAKEFNYFLKKIGAYIALTQTSKDRLIDYGIAENKINVIYHYELASKHETKVDVANPSVVFVGWLSKENGTDILIEAFAQVTKELKDVSLYLVGTGDEKFVGEIQEKLVNQGIAEKVIFLGKRDNKETLSIVSKCDVVVVPHQWPKEFGPIILLEALALGKPVIASRIGATEEFIDHGRNGFLVDDFRNPIAFAERIRQLLGHPEIASEMGKNARKSTSQLFGASCIDKLLALYNSLLDKR